MLTETCEGSRIVSVEELVTYSRHFLSMLINGTEWGNTFKSIVV